MSKKFLVAIIATCLIVGCYFAVGTWGEEEEDHVVIGTTAKFDEFVAKNNHVLVEFYAPWCGHCKSLAPHYAKAAERLKKTDPAVPLMKIDATVESELASRFDVKGYPTLKWFVNGTPMDYAGERTEESIVSWVTKKTGPATKVLTTKDELEEFTKNNKVAVVYFGENNESFATFNSVALSMEGVAFGNTFNSDLVAEYGTKVVLFKQFDEKRNDFEGPLEATTLTNFLEENRYELVMQFEGDDAIQRIFGQEEAAIFLFSETEGEHNDVFTNVAGANKGRIIFSHSTVSSGLGQRLAEYVGVTAEQIPCLRIVKPQQGDLAKFIYNGEITTEGVNKFLSDYESGKLDRNYKSGEAPETNDEAVKVIVGTTFDKMVTDSDADVLIEFVAPWCGHCQKLGPIFEDLAKKVAHMDQLVIAKIDATENEIPGADIKGFPTIKFYKKGRKDSPVSYDGERTEEEFLKFLKENVSFEWVETVVETDL